MTKTTIYDRTPIPDGLIKYSVIAARYEGKWIFARHEGRKTWEIPGGHREAGETPDDCARRELWEETGALDFDLTRVTAYGVKIDDDEEGYGMLYFAEVTKIGPLPAYEIEERALFDTMPDEQTYPDIQPVQFDYIQGWLNLRSSPDELWDVYDENRCLTGHLHRRGEVLSDGEYHLVVQVFVRRSDGKYLLTKRAPTKGFGNMWECTGGSALAGDDSLSAAIREVREETGLRLSPESGRLILSRKYSDAFLDVWLFEREFDLSDVVLQAGETVDKMTADESIIREMKNSGELVPYDWLEGFFEKMKEE